MTYPISYYGTTDVTGPSQISPAPPGRVNPDGSVDYFFDITVAPCGVNPPCYVEVRLGSPSALKIARLTVNP